MYDSTSAIEISSPALPLDVMLSEADSGSSVLLEAKSLQIAFQGTEGEIEPSEAKARLRRLLGSRTSEPSLESSVIQVSINHILGSVGEGISPPPKKANLDALMVHTLSYAWFLWLEGCPELGLELLDQFKTSTANSHRVAGSSGAMNRGSMRFWLQALEHLFRDEKDDAKRLWKRAMELGSHFGTDSHLLVCWTYVATFFPTS